MNRDEALDRTRSERSLWDLVVVGGGATGLGAAVDAATRGYRTLLLEAHDFGKGASSKSTKLAHGGVRYLRQARLGLVREALRERARLLANAPHLSRAIPFVVPSRSWRERATHAIGFRLYDYLAGANGLGLSRSLSVRETLELVPTLNVDSIAGAIAYQDGQFDDARLLVDLARAAWREGATILNHARVVSLVRSSGAWSVAFEDSETGTSHEVGARSVVSAAGAFADDVRRLEDPGAIALVRPSRGTHVVLDRRFFPGDAALLVPDVGGGRVAFLVPWRQCVLLGTTDVAMDAPADEPRPADEEIRELLETAGRILAVQPGIADVKSTFAGVRPLVASSARSTAAASREHLLHVSRGGLVTITGGKWTTYRSMAAVAIDRAAALAGVPARECRTQALRIEGVAPPAGVPVHEEDVRRAIRDEMARTLEDVLARRLGTLFVDARAAVAAAPEVARVFRQELGRDAEWAREQILAFRARARECLPIGTAD